MHHKKTNKKNKKQTKKPSFMKRKIGDNVVFMCPQSWDVYVTGILQNFENVF